MKNLRTIRLERIWHVAQTSYAMGDLKKTKKALRILANRDKKQGELARGYIKTIESMERCRKAGLGPDLIFTDPIKLDSIGWEYEDPLDSLIQEEIKNDLPEI
jgi:hypothetical protein